MKEAPTTRGIDAGIVAIVNLMGRVPPLVVDVKPSLATTSAKQDKVLDDRGKLSDAEALKLLFEHLAPAR
jgi:hypothetical protein